MPDLVQSDCCLDDRQLLCNKKKSPVLQNSIFVHLVVDFVEPEQKFIHLDLSHLIDSAAYVQSFLIGHKVVYPFDVSGFPENNDSSFLN